MPNNFDLLITTNAASTTADLRLLDAHGNQLAFRHTDFSDISASHRDGLFNLRHHLELLVEDQQQAATIAEVGECIAREVLGSELFELLAATTTTRTLRIRLPDAAADNPLAAQLARVPWELACRAPGHPTLAERNLLVRVVNTLAEPVPPALGLGAGEPLRVLFVFAEALGSRPLEARQERRELLALFTQKIYPQRRVVAHFLSHGVTRERLETQLRENGGYHIVHWSGHGSRNQLELARPGGGADYLTGDELLTLFNDTGGLLPQLIFLSACNSGDLLRVRDWNDFLAVAQGQRQAGAEPAPSPGVAPSGYTGTAQALLAGGVPSVVAMRYAVGDTYARELAVAFYDALLAYPQPQSVAAALLTARQQLRKQADQSRLAPCDHATPVLYGAAQPDLRPPTGDSPALSARSPRLHQVPELTIAEHQYFVGRTWELAGLGTDFIGAGVRPVAVLTGLGGMGKTALTAEALSLWEPQFRWVLLYQAKPNALNFEGTFRDLHLKLVEDSPVYHQHIQQYPADAIYREATASFTGPDRLDRLTRNLIRAFRHEPVLLVLDNFEANLKPNQEPGPDAPRWACQDPAWDRCLTQLAAGLASSSSRVLITSRWPLAALPDAVHYPVRLGPLPAGEAALYVRGHEGLRTMAANAEDYPLVRRLLKASRFHPLLLDSLARLATGGPALRDKLRQALEALETTHDYSQLPDLFATVRGDERVAAYLSDALTTSLDLLIQGATPDARRLLWLIALANEPVLLSLLDCVWRGESPEYEWQWQLRQELVNFEQLPPERQEELHGVPPEFRAELAAMLPLPTRPSTDSLLAYLRAVGLATLEYSGPEDTNPILFCHELVRERIQSWMAAHPQDLGELTENNSRVAYAEWLENVCNYFQHRDQTIAAEAGRRAIVYYVQAHAYERLGDFVSKVVSSGAGTRLLETLIPHLEQASRDAPDGMTSWTSRGHLADALRRAGRSAASLPYYEQATARARAATIMGGDIERQAWSDLGWLAGNWANALSDVGLLQDARQRQMESVEAKKKVGKSAITIIATELEVLRLDVMQNQAETARPEIEERLAQVQAWWQQHQAGQPVPEAPNAELLARALISALDIAKDADQAQNDWTSMLKRTDAILTVKRTLGRPEEEIAVTRMNRAVTLAKLDRIAEAQAELENCLEIFGSSPDKRAMVLSSLASLFDDQGDFPQAIAQERRALAIEEKLDSPDGRATSHGNLAIYLKNTEHPAYLAEAPRHQLAALLYRFVADLTLALQVSIRNYVIVFRQAHAAGTRPSIPRITELLANPAFHPLAEWLRERQVNLTALQTQVDQFLEQARQAATEQP